MQTIKEQIKTGQLSHFHLLYGDERYLVRYYKNQIIKVLGMEDDEMNFARYEGTGIEISVILDVAHTLPFFAEQRLILIEDSGFFKSSNDLVDFLGEIPNTTYILFVERDVDKRNRLYKYINKNGCVTDVKQNSESELIRWVAAYFKSVNKEIRKSTIILILNKVGSSMETLSMELEKIIGYAWNKDVIEDVDVEAVCTNQISGKIFEMIDAVAERNLKRALHLYDDLLQLKEPPTRILYLLTRHVNQMIQVKEEEKRSSRADIAKNLKIPPFAIGKVSTQARKFSTKQLFEMLVQSTKMEEDVKTGRLIDQLAVEMFIVKYANQ